VVKYCGLHAVHMSKSKSYRTHLLHLLPVSSTTLVSPSFQQTHEIEGDGHLQGFGLNRIATLEWPGRWSGRTLVRPPPLRTSDAYDDRDAFKTFPWSCHDRALSDYRFREPASWSAARKAVFHETLCNRKSRDPARLSISLRTCWQDAVAFWSKGYW
jgi:hypothetical protein